METRDTTVQVLLPVVKTVWLHRSRTGNAAGLFEQATPRRAAFNERRAQHSPLGVGAAVPFPFSLRERANVSSQPPVAWSSPRACKGD